VKSDALARAASGLKMVIRVNDGAGQKSVNVLRSRHTREGR